MHRFRLTMLGAAAAVTLAAAACGGDGGSGVPSASEGAGSPGPSETTGGPGASGGGSGAELAACMRDNGIEIGDADPETGLPEIGDSVDPDTPAFDEAMEACEDLLPPGGLREPSGTQDLAPYRAFAECMRDNGMQDFPDPQPGGEGVFGDDSVDRSSPAFQQAADACQHTLDGVQDAEGSR